MVGDDGKVTSLAKVNVPMYAENDWDHYSVVKGSISKSFETGKQLLRFTTNGANCNIDKVTFKCTTPATGIEQVTAEQKQSAPHNLYGVKVGDGYRGIVIVNGKKILKK